MYLDWTTGNGRYGLLGEKITWIAEDSLKLIYHSISYALKGCFFGHDGVALMKNDIKKYQQGPSQLFDVAVIGEFSTDGRF